MSRKLVLGGCTCHGCLKRTAKDNYKGDIGFQTKLPTKVLEDGSVVHTTGCTLCDYIETFIIKPELHQPTRRFCEDITTGKLYKDKRKVPVGVTYRTKFVPVGEPYLIHWHDSYGAHPVKTKHKQTTSERRSQLQYDWEIKKIMNKHKCSFVKAQEIQKQKMKGAFIATCKKCGYFEFDILDWDYQDKQLWRLKCKGCGIEVIFDLTKYWNEVKYLDVQKKLK